MSVLAKLAALGGVITAGSLLVLWAAFSGQAALAWLALAATAALATGAIVVIAREAQRADRVRQ